MNRPGTFAGGDRSGRNAGGRNMKYLRAKVETATPTQLVVMLYDGAVRFCSLALEAMELHQFEDQNTNIKRAEDIVCELMGSLNQEAGGEVAANLLRIYTYLYEQLVQSNLNDDVEALKRVLAHLDALRESWVELDRQSRAGAISPSPVNSSKQRLGDFNA